MEACCNNCANWKNLEHWTYNSDGTVDHVSKGEKCCICFAYEGTVIHMEGGDPNTDMCECYREKERRGMTGVVNR